MLREHAGAGSDRWRIRNDILFKAAELHTSMAEVVDFAVKDNPGSGRRAKGLSERLYKRGRAVSACMTSGPTGDPLPDLAGLLEGVEESKGDLERWWAVEEYVREQAQAN